MKLLKKKHIEGTKLYHVNNFEKQIKLNKKNKFSKENEYLHYFSSLLCFDRKKKQLKKLRKKLKIIKFN